MMSSSSDDMIKELKKEVHSLKEKLQKSNEKVRLYEEQNQQNKQEESEKQKKENLLSKQQIHDFVDELIKDENINIRFLPDHVEKQIYTNILIILMQIIQHSVEDLKVSFMGHEITMKMDPLKLKK